MIRFWISTILGSAEFRISFYLHIPSWEFQEMEGIRNTMRFTFYHQMGHQDELSDPSKHMFGETGVRTLAFRQTESICSLSYFISIIFAGNEQTLWQRYWEIYKQMSQTL